MYANIAWPLQKRIAALILSINFGLRLGIEYRGLKNWKELGAQRLCAVRMLHSQLQAASEKLLTALQVSRHDKTFELLRILAKPAGKTRNNVFPKHASSLEMIPISCSPSPKPQAPHSTWGRQRFHAVLRVHGF